MVFDCRRRSAAALAAVGLLTPSLAWAGALTPVGVFFDAHPLMKLIMVGLVVATAAAVVVCAFKLASGSKLSGGSAYLSGMRAGGPLAGLLGAGYVGFNIFLGLANAPSSPPLNLVAPGLAEAVLLMVLGLLCGAVATVAHWAVEARIDRAVLRA